MSSKKTGESLQSLESGSGYSYESSVFNEDLAKCAIWNTNFSMTKKDDGLTVGVAVLSKRTRLSDEDQKKFVVSLYQFGDCTQLTNLESLLVRLKPSICYHETLDTKKNVANGFKRKITNLLNAVDVEGSELELKTFAQVDDISSSTAFMSGAHGDDAKRCDALCQSNAVAVGALSALIRAESLDCDQELRGVFEFEQANLKEYMRLDAAALDALDLFPNGQSRNGHQMREHSILGILDHCKTKNLGTRLLSQWIRQPLLEVDAITYRQDIVEELVNDQMKRQQIQDALSNVPDLHHLVRKIESGKAGLQELYHLYLFAGGLPRLDSSIQGNEPTSSSVKMATRQLAEEVQYLCKADRFQKFCDLIESVLDLRFVPREFRVRTSHDDTGELVKLCEEMESIDTRVSCIRNQLEDGVLSDFGPKFETDPSMLRTYGYHFRISKKYDSDLKQVSEGSYLAVVSACIRWSTPELKELYDSYVGYRSSYHAKQRNIVAQAVHVASTYIPLFEKAASVVAEIDVLTSLAHMAAFSGESGYVRPKMIPLDADEKARELRISAARHPCLELQDGVSFIPNDYEMIPGKSKFQIVTGPNMGGKSVWLRTLGCIAVMAQIGSFVPASSAQIPVLDAVLARVGAGDIQLRGVSTFMAEMLEASAIISSATQNSLVLLDELGRGTSTYDGFGLAWAISEHLINTLRPLALFATHFHEITALENLKGGAGVRNKHVTALPDGDALTLLYTVNDGPCMESFGINIAVSAGFPEGVVKSAKRKADELESFVCVGTDAEATGRKRLNADKATTLVRKLAELDESQAVDLSYVKKLIGSV